MNNQYRGPNERQFVARTFQDPQITVEGRLKQGENADTITFNYRFNEIYELVCIVTIPPDGEQTAPVYVKHKCHRPRHPIDYRMTEQVQRNDFRPNNRRELGNNGEVQDDDDEQSPSETQTA